MREVKEISGRRFGCLVVGKRVGYGGTREVLWSWRCDCGAEGRSRGSKIRASLKRRCWHIAWGSCRTVEYRVWERMKARCYDAKRRGFANYGGRGIKVCERWRGDFAAFLADMGRRPSAEHSLDRIDVDGDYEPGNCRWATDKEQRRNKRVTMYVERGGILVRLVDLCEELGLNRQNVASRLRVGWSLIDAITVPVRGYVKG